MKKKRKIIVSIVLYNNKEKVLKKTIESVLCSNIEVKLLLIDNSPNRRLQKFEDFDKDITYIFLGKNIGYGAAHNIAIEKSIQEKNLYHLVLNPDVYFNDNVLNELYEYMEANHGIGNIIPNVFFPNREIQYLAKLLPTPIDLFVRRFFMSTNWEKNRQDRFELKFSNYLKTMNVPSLSGCFMFLRVSAIIDVGMFDENIFLYMEDIDLNRRIHKKYKTIFYPELEVIHEHGKGSYQNYNLLKCHISSAIYYFNKWGWFFDKERKKSNALCLKNLDYKK